MDSFTSFFSFDVNPKKIPLPKIRCSFFNGVESQGWDFRTLLITIEIYKHIYLELQTTSFFMVVSIGWFQIIIYIKNGCFTKHPLKNGCLGYQVGVESLRYCGYRVKCVHTVGWGNSVIQGFLTVLIYFGGQLTCQRGHKTPSQEGQKGLSGM